ncbi:MAG: type II secretion system protein [Phycisphaerae bacterium]|jgi:prepilin-type N-terminal cleavage/methylation domain-containing protein
MKSEGKTTENSHAKTGFTIIELLTAMSIIVILLSLLVPSLNTMRWYARYTTQKNQLKNIETGLHSFEMDFGEYPDSNRVDITGTKYCGAMKLAEAMAGQDGFGFHPDSVLRADGTDGTNVLYPDTPPPENLRSRKEYMEARDVQLCTLVEFHPGAPGWSYPDKIVLLCDVYKRNNLRNSKGDKLGMPILYYKADTSKLSHDVNDPTNTDNIYNYMDNHEFVGLDVSWDPFVHPLYDPNGTPGETFYKMTRDESVPIVGSYNALKIRPYNKNSYILISAGRDGVYGTDDDVCNFKQ